MCDGEVEGIALALEGAETDNTLILADSQAAIRTCINMTKEAGANSGRETDRGRGRTKETGRPKARDRAGQSAKEVDRGGGGEGKGGREVGGGKGERKR